MKTTSGGQTSSFFPRPHLPFLASMPGYLKGLLSTQNDHMVISAYQKAHPPGFPKCLLSVLPY